MPSKIFWSIFLIAAFLCFLISCEEPASTYENTGGCSGTPDSNNYEGTTDNSSDESSNNSSDESSNNSSDESSNNGSDESPNNSAEETTGDANAEVYLEGSTWIASNTGSQVYSGTDMLDAIQAAVDSLTPGRTWKETVVLKDSGSTGTYTWDGDVKSVDLADYTVIDLQGTITVNDDSGEDDIVPIRAMGKKYIEIRNARIEGNPRYGIWIQSCNEVHLGNIWMSLWEAETVGLGVRIDESRGSRSSNVTIDYAYVEGSKHHGVETYGVDNITINMVETVDTGGCGLILNDTANASVGTVNATRPNVGGGYAGFRTANNAGPDIHVDKVIVNGGARGFFCVSGSHGIAIEQVDITESENQGILIEDCQDVSVNGGTVLNTFNQGVRITSRSSTEHAAS
ncbi:MAG: right-handed parallel beta-helix repeat-containing protein, partial [Desulfobacteraceae bacterium]